ncbi:hypothetical protein BN946_scf185010.g3 [Trametes cinnabarina]|uniref:Uncharacterized protein n=1 Tax=Pycnoporus cinnabarinus TaxID=5643 RepID=A0A060SRI7_PYCCI|nr:hypothetical protein BN946_scf185010.g3 [Trametes cinnabarina]
MLKIELDGARNPPKFYVTLEEINADRVAAGYPAIPPYSAPMQPRLPTPPPAPEHPATAASMYAATLERDADLPNVHAALSRALSPAPVPPPPSTDTAVLQVPERVLHESFVAPRPVSATQSGEPSVEIANNPGNDGPAGHLVAVSVVYLNTVPAGGRSSHGATKKVKQKVVKSDHILLAGLSRTDFLHAALAVHELADQYSAGVHSGPPVKIWWSGSSSGKSGASTVENDHDFNVTKAAILKRNKDTCVVNIEFDLEGMAGYRIRKRLIKLYMRTMTSSLAGKRSHGSSFFSDEAQINGQIIMQLKAKWACERHQGEHGEPGYCYVDVAGTHLGLNHRKLKLWAAAIAAADATKHHPPNTVDFDCLRDGRLNVSLPRGRTGGGSSTNGSATTTGDLAALLMVAIIPLVTSQLAPKPAVPADVPMAEMTGSSSPVLASQDASPALGTELHACLRDFLARKGIDLLEAEPALAALELTPDIIHEVPALRLCDVIGAVEGRIRKFQLFCKDWTVEVEEKRRRGL